MFKIKISPFLYILIFISFLNLIQILRPYPVGWDDLNKYALNAKMIHEGIAPNPPFTWELILSLGYYINPTASFVISWLGVIFAIISFYSLLKEILKEKEISLMLTTVFFSLPAVVYQSAFDLKVDLPMLGFLCWSLLCLLQKRYVLSAYLAVVTFSIKYLAIIL